MANKKITDLQLIAAATSGLSLPADDGIQTYRTTAAQLKAFILANGNITLSMLEAAIFNGLSSATPAADDYFIMNDTSDGNLLKKALVSAFARNGYRAASGATTVQTTDRTVTMSGASATVTLPATGNAGVRYTIVHLGTSLTQVYTIATDGGTATIGGIASGSYALYTNGERLTVEDDGTNWQIVEHEASSVEFDAGALTVSTTGGGSPAFGSGVVNKLICCRQGIFNHFRWDLDQAAAGSAGSGDYILTLPTGLSADTTNMRLNNNTIGSGSPSDYSYVGTGGLYDGTNANACSFYFATSTTVKVNIHQVGVWRSSIRDLTSNPLVISIEGKYPVTGWRP